jgi:hypothetical protein
MGHYTEALGLLHLACGSAALLTPQAGLLQLRLLLAWRKNTMEGGKVRDKT